MARRAATATLSASACTSAIERGGEYLHTMRPLRYAEALESAGWRAYSSGEVDGC